MASINFTGSIGMPGNAPILGNYDVVFTADANHTMAAVEYSNNFLYVTSSVTLTQTRSLICPMTQGQQFIVQNDTIGTQSVLVIGATGIGVTLKHGDTALVVCDGYNYLLPAAAILDGYVILNGDVTGNSNANTVVALQNNPLAPGLLGSAQDGYVLTWKNSLVEWVAEPAAIGFTAGGNLSGSNTSQEVIGLLNHSLPALSDGYLNWTGSAWALSSIGSGFTAAGDLSGSSSSQTVIGLDGTPLSITSLVSGDALVYNGTDWINALIVNSNVSPSAAIAGSKITSATTGALGVLQLGGDLAGTATSQTVVGLDTTPIVLTSLTTNNLLQYNGTDWVNIAPTSIGAVTWANDLAGSTSTDQYVSSISGNAGAGGTIPINAAALAFASGQTSPTIDQTALGSTSAGSGSAGQALLIEAQAGQAATGAGHNGGKGGDLDLSSGIGGTSGSATAGAPGGVSLQLAGTELLRISGSTPGNITVTNTAAVPTISQSNLTTNSGTGNNFTIQAQNETGTTSHGGSLYLTSGTGTTADGYVYIEHGGTVGITLKPTNVVSIADLGTGVVHSDASGNLTSSTIIDADVSSSAAIEVSKLQAGTSGQVLLNNGTPTPTWTTLSQDAVVSSTGAVTVQGIQAVPISGAPSNNQVPAYVAASSNIQWVNLASVTGGGTTTSSFIQPAVGLNVNVNVTSTVGFTNATVLFIQDLNASGGYYNIQTVVSSTQFTLTNLGGYGASQAGTGILSGAIFIVAGKDVNAVNLDAFGDGYDGYFNPGASGVTTLTRDMFYSSMGPWPAGSTATINATGFIINCSGRCNMQNAPTNAISWNGVSGGAGDAGTGGTAAGGVTAGIGTIGVGNSGGAGGTATEGAGGNGVAGLLAQWSNGGISKVGGAGGAGLAGAYAGGTSPQPGYTPYNQVLFHRLPDMLSAACVLISGGGGGSGGGAGGGNGAVDGAGGGGGGSGGCVGRLNVNELFVDNTVSSGAISVIGGNGGNGGSATGGVGCGGGGGGSGGSGGYLFLNIGVLSGAGSGSTNVILGSGGNGGNGGFGDSIGSSDGYGGYGGAGGLVEIAHGGLQLVTDYFGGNWGSPSGQTGGTGGLLGVPLIPPNPQITGVFPNWGSAEGGWVIKIAGANLSTVSSVKINGLACTSVSYSGGTGLITATTPKYLSGATGYKNGSTTGQTVTVVVSGGGIATSAGNQLNYFYIPSNTAITEAHAGNANVTTGTGVSSLGSLLPSGGYAWAQVTGGDQPTILTAASGGFNGSGLAGLSFNGTTDYMSIASMTTGAGPGATFFWVAQTIAVPSYQAGINYPGLNLYFQAASGGQLVLIPATGTAVWSGAIDNAAHLYCGDAPGSSGTCSIFVDNVSKATTTGYASASTSGIAYLGYRSGDFLNFNYGADLLYAAQITSADRATIHSIFSQIYGTP